jgi:hypothetical protein
LWDRADLRHPVPSRPSRQVVRALFRPVMTGSSHHFLRSDGSGICYFPDIPHDFTFRARQQEYQYPPH